VTDEHNGNSNGNGASNGQAPPRLNLSPDHLATLRLSGLDDTTILAAGVQTVTDANLIKRCLNWDFSAVRLGPCIVFPYRKPDQQKMGFARVRPDKPRVRKGKIFKYESPAGCSPRLYFSPTATPEALADVSIPLCIIEGEKKTLRGAQGGLVAVGVAGVWGWQLAREEDDDGKKMGSRQMLPDFDLIQLRSRVAYLIFDSDVAVNPKAGWGEYHLAALLQGRGADVRIVRLPPGAPDADGKPAKIGLDDYLLTHTADDLRVLMASAKAPEKPEPDTALEADADPHRLARLFVEQCRYDGLLDTVRYWRDEFHRWDGAAYRPLPAKEVKAELTTSVKAEFDRLNIEAQKRRQKAEAEDGTDKSGDGGDGQGKKKKQALEAAERVTTRLIADVTQALAGVCLLPSSVEQPAWLTPSEEWEPAEILPCSNGLLHLRSLIADKDHLIPPTPLFFSRNCLDYDFDFDAPPCTEWLAFLKKLWPDDPQSIDTLQEWFGYTLTPDTSQQKIMTLIGPPRSGKGTVARVHRRVIGEANVCSPTLSGLAGNFGLQPLLGKMLAIISDARLSRRSDLATITERLLSISGEDGQTVDRKHLPSVEGKLSVRFEILSNELPRLTDASGALVSRMIVLRFVRSWLGDEDIHLTARLLKELPAILLWSIEGWRRLRERGRFVQPASGAPLVTDLENLSSPVGAFVRDCCTLPDGKTTFPKDMTIPVRDLFARWKTWCEDKGKKDAGDEPWFGRNLRSVVAHLEVTRPRIEGTDNKGPREYRGIRLKTDDELKTTGDGDIPA
jgi:putative DNA primase/helicase